MAKPDFLPTDQDILHIYIPTKGIYEYTNETNFLIEEIPFNIIDVGGNKAERKKWIYCLEKTIQAVLFVASLSEFDEFSSGCDTVSLKTRAAAQKSTLDSYSLHFQPLHVRTSSSPFV
jgi:hypothetical protein